MGRLVFKKMSRNWIFFSISKRFSIGGNVWVLGFLKWDLVLYHRKLKH